jgi:hypothetical protein
VKASRLHKLATIGWCGLAVPTMLWWRESIQWVSFMSIYAIIVGHWSTYQAAKAEEAANDESGERP